MGTSPSFSDLFDQARERDEYWEEDLIAEFTDELLRWMEERSISRSELASRIGHRPSYVTKVLRGDANFTAMTMAKLARAVGARMRMHLAPEGSRTVWYDVVTGGEEASTSFEELKMPQKRLRLNATAEKPSSVGTSSLAWSANG